MKNIKAISKAREETRLKIDTSVSINLDFYDVEAQLKKAFTSEDEMSRLHCDTDEDKKSFCVFDEAFNKKFIETIKDSLDEFEIEAIKLVDYVECK